MDDELRQARARVAELEAALRPFAALAAVVLEPEDEGCTDRNWYDARSERGRAVVAYPDLRAARRALSGSAPAPSAIPISVTVSHDRLAGTVTVSATFEERDAHMMPRDAYALLRAIEQAVREDFPAKAAEEGARLALEAAIERMEQTRGDGHDKIEAVRALLADPAAAIARKP